jgi:alpha-L-fucosidase
MHSHSPDRIVSKNGNLLMDIALRADGTLDQEAVVLLKGMGQWLKVNGEGIYGTRPYAVFGEGPTLVQGSHYAAMAELTARDFRFTTKGDTVFALIKQFISMLTFGLSLV